MRPAFDPDRTLRTLVRHGVDFVLIGGLAGVLHGSPATTNDADIVPRRAPENLERLASALLELNARIRTEGIPEGLAFDCSAVFLDRTEVLNLQTDAGDLDVTHRPAGSAGYAELDRRAIVVPIDDYSVRVAALDDIIHSKRTADRPKDRLTLPILEALRDEIDAQGT